MSDTFRNGIDKTALSYWFPKLVEAGIPVPKTTIIKMPVEVQKVIWGWFDGKDDGNKTEAPFMNELIPHSPDDALISATLTPIQI